jgi:hypothetical protein
MLELTCLGCGWEGQVPARFAGRRVTCKRCQTVNTAPDPESDSATREVDAFAWVAAMPPAGGSVTREVDMRDWPSRG